MNDNDGNESPMTCGSSREEGKGDKEEDEDVTPHPDALLFLQSLLSPTDSKHLLLTMNNPRIKDKNLSLKDLLEAMVLAYQHQHQQDTKNPEEGRTTMAKSSSSTTNNNNNKREDDDQGVKFARLKDAISSQMADQVDHMHNLVQEIRSRENHPTNDHPEVVGEVNETSAAATTTTTTTKKKPPQPQQAAGNNNNNNELLLRNQLKQASHDWKSLVAIERWEKQKKESDTQMECLKQLSSTTYAVALRQIEEITIDLVSVLQNKDIMINLGRLLCCSSSSSSSSSSTLSGTTGAEEGSSSTTTSTAAPTGGILRLNLTSIGHRRRQEEILRNNPLAKQFRNILTSPSNTVTQLKISDLEGTTLFNMSSRTHGIQNYRMKNILPSNWSNLRFFLYRRGNNNGHHRRGGRPLIIYPFLFDFNWIYPIATMPKWSSSCWSPPWWGCMRNNNPQSHHLSKHLLELVLSRIHFHGAFTIAALLEFLEDQQQQQQPQREGQGERGSSGASCFRRLKLLNCTFHNQGQEYIQPLLEGQLGLMEELEMIDCYFCQHCNKNDPKFSKKQLQKTVKRLMLQNNRNSQQRHSASAAFVPLLPPKRVLRRVVLSGRFSDTANSNNVLNSLGTALGSNPWLTKLTLRPCHNRVGVVQAFVKAATTTTAGPSSLESCAAIAAAGVSGGGGAAAAITSLRYLDIEGETTEEWIQEMIALIRHPACAIRHLTVRFANPLLEGAANATTNADGELFVESLEMLLEQGLANNNSIERLDCMHLHSFANIYHGATPPKEQYLRELSILTKAFLVSPSSSGGTSSSSSSTPLKALLFDAPGALVENDADVEEVFGNHFFNKEDKRSTLEEVQVGQDGLRSVGIQYNALRNRMKAAVRRSVVKLSSPSLSALVVEDTDADTPPLIWPNVIRSLLTWLQSDPVKTMDKNMLDSLYLSGIFIGISEAPLVMMAELQDNYHHL